MGALKRGAAALLCAGLLLGCSGCSGTSFFSDFRRIEKLEVIRTVGVDLQGSAVAVSAGSGVGLNGKTPHLYFQEGASLTAAVEALLYSYPARQPYFSHTENMLVGEAAARSDLEPVLDYVERSPDMRLMTNLFIVRGGTARDMMKAVMSEQSSASDMLLNIRSDAEMQGAGSVYTCGETAAALADRGCALVQAVALAPCKQQGLTREMIVPDGFALVRDGRVVDFLDSRLSAAANLLSGRFKASEFVLRTADGACTAEVNRADAAFTPVYRDGALERLDIRIRAAACIQQVSGAAAADDARRAALEAALGDALARLAEETVSFTQSRGADYLDLGGRAERAAPARFRALEPSWAARFPELPCRFAAEVTLERTFDIGASVPTEGEHP